MQDDPIASQFGGTAVPTSSSDDDPIAAQFGGSFVSDTPTVRPPPVEARGFTQPDSVKVTAPETTTLAPSEERQFQSWARTNKIADVDHPDSHYDYRGFWKESGGQSVQFGVDHFPDTFKQHGHPTFSVESKYSKGPTDGGTWDGDTFKPAASTSDPLASRRFYVSTPLSDITGEGVKQIGKGLAKIPGNPGLVPWGTTDHPLPPPKIDPEFGSKMMDAANDLIEGTFKASTPLLLVGAGMNPVATVLGVIKTTVAAKATKKAAEAVGASPEAQRLAGNIAAVAAGTVSARRAMQEMLGDAHAVMEQARAFDAANPDLAPGYVAPPKPVGRGKSGRLLEPVKTGLPERGTPPPEPPVIEPLEPTPPEPVPAEAPVEQPPADIDVQAALSDLATAEPGSPQAKTALVALERAGVDAETIANAVTPPVDPVAEAHGGVPVETSASAGVAPVEATAVAEGQETAEAPPAEAEAVPAPGFGGYAGPERRVAVAEPPGGVDRRDLPIDAMSDIVGAARQMRTENPAIDQQARELARAPRRPAKELTYDQFAQQYRQAFKDAMRYTPNQVGWRTFTDKMAEFSDAHPEFVARLEAEEDAVATAHGGVPVTIGGSDADTPPAIAGRAESPQPRADAEGRDSEGAAPRPAAQEQRAELRAHAKERRVEYATAVKNAPDEVIGRLVEKAQTAGYTGDPAVLRDELASRLQLIHDFDAEFNTSGHNPQELLRAIAKYGGISVDKESSLKGELRWLSEHASKTGKGASFGRVAGVNGVYNKRGQSIDDMLTSLKQESKFDHIETLEDLREEIQAATMSGDKKVAADRLERSLGAEWWKTLAPVASDFEDDLALLRGEDEDGDIDFDPDTLEAQPRLPEAGKVRERDVETPKFEAPFSLSGEAVETKAVEPSLFGDERPKFSQREDQPIFYSALTRAAEALPQAKGTPDQMLAMLQKAKGVKQEELNWTGVIPWLKSQSGSVSKADIVAYLRANELQLSETMLGGEEATGAAEPDGAGGLVTPTIGRATKFSAHTLPGGEHYRELLITLPASTPVGPKVPDGAGGLVAPTVAPGWQMIEGDRNANTQGDFTGGHFDQPNVLVHLRVNDRTDTDGNKVLFIEEVQSDWHQRGRKHGYAGQLPELPPLVAHKDVTMTKGEHSWTARVPDGRMVEIGLGTEPVEADARAYAKAYFNNRREELAQMRREDNRDKVPDAPFKTTWPELAMKRAVRYASEHGYDKVAWTTGDQQNDRYDLSKKVNAVFWQPNERILTVELKDGGHQQIAKDVTPDKLADYVGKDIAERIVKPEAKDAKHSAAFDSGSSEGTLVHSVRGENLKVGGKGMVGFYDKILPTFMAKFGKPFGATVGETQIRTDNAPADVVERYADQPDHPFTKRQKATVHAVDITPTMRKSAMDGLPLFSPTPSAGDSAVAYYAQRRQASALLSSTYADMGTFTVKGRQTPATILDSGSVLTDAERERITASPEFQAATKVVLDVLDDIIGTMLGDDRGAVERTGILLADHIYGVFLPKPGSAGQLATIQINPFEHMIGTDPAEGAKRTYYTIVHEVLHNEIPMDGPAFEKELLTRLERLGPDRAVRASRRIMEAYEDPQRPGAYRPALRQLLSLYSASRRRPVRVPDAVSASLGRPARSATEPDAARPPPDDVRPSRKRSVTLDELRRIAKVRRTTLEVQMDRAKAAGYEIEDRAERVRSMPFAAAPAADEPGRSPRRALPQQNRPLPKGLTQWPLDKIVTRLSRLFGVPTSVGQMPRGTARASAVYKQRSQAVRARAANALQEVAHEFGHHIDLAMMRASGSASGALATELMALGRPTSLPEYEPSDIRMEGAAEFFRRWLIEPETLGEAPEAFAAFTRWMKAEPRLAKALGEVKTQVQGYLSLSPVEQAKLHIDYSGGSSGVMATAQAIIDRVKTADGRRDALTYLSSQWVNDLAAIKALEADLTAGHPVDIADSAYVLSRIARGYAEKAEGFLKHGVRNADGEFTGRSFNAALAGVDNLEDFSVYWAAKRAETLHARGLASGMTGGQIKDTIREHQSEAFDEALVGMREYHEAMRAYMVESGLITQKLADDLDELEPFYAPYWRVQDAAGGFLSGRRLANRSSTLKRMKGSTRRIVNPLETVIRNTHQTTEAGETNRAMLALVNLITETDGSAIWMEEIPVQQAATRFNLDQLENEIRGQLADQGVEIPDDVSLKGLATVFTPKQFVVGSSKFVTVLDKGKRRWFEVHDDGLFDAITAVGPGAAAEVVKWFGKGARLLQQTATLTVGFGVRNVVRDMFQARTLTRAGYVPVYDNIRAMFEYFGAGEKYQLYLQSGAGQAAFMAGDRNLLRKHLRELGHKGAKDFIKDTVLHPVDALRAFHQAIETSTRLAEFMRTMKKLEKQGIVGRSAIVQAGLNARDVTQDFQVKGIQARAWNNYVAFFAAQIGGVTRLAQEITESPKGWGPPGGGGGGKPPIRHGQESSANGGGSSRVPRIAKNLSRLLWRGILTISLLSALLWTLNHDDDEYNELPAWERNAYWHIPLTGGGWIRLRKPFEIGMFFGTGVEVALDWLLNEDPALRGRLMSKDTALQMAQTIIPSAALPAIQVMANHEFYFDRPIVSPWDENLDPELQYNRWTSESAKKLGRWMNMSPAKIESLIYGHTAGVGRAALQAADAALGAKKPSSGLMNVPIVGTLYRAPVMSDAASLSELYELRDAIDGYRSSATRWKAAGESSRADAALAALNSDYADVLSRTKNASVLGLREDVASAARQLSARRKTVNNVFANGTMSPDQKRQALDREFSAMLNIARGALGRAPLRRAASPP